MADGTGRMRAAVLACWMLVGCAVLSACGAGPGAGGGGVLTGTASTGAALADAKVLLIDRAGAVAASATADAHGNFSLSAPSGSPPYLLVASSSGGSADYLAIDYGAPQVATISNVNPISNLVARIELLGAGMPQQTIDSITAGAPQAAAFAAVAGQLHAAADAQARASLDSVLAPIVSAIAGSDKALSSQLSGAHGDIVGLLLDGSIQGMSHTGLDNVLDQIAVHYTTGSSGSAEAQLSLPAAPDVAPVQLSVASVAALARGASSSAANAASAAQSAAGALQLPPPTVVLSASSQWGSASTSWAGYTGSLVLWVPQAVSGGWTLSFRSQTLGAQARSASFWGAKASYDPATHTFTLSNAPYNATLAAGSTVGIGFSASGVLSSAVDLQDCRFNGQSCALEFARPAAGQATIAQLLGDFASVPGSRLGSISGNVSSALQATQGSANQSAAADAGAGLTRIVAGSQPAGSGASASGLQVEWQVPSAWSGGYSGMLVVRNTGTATLVAPWRLQLNFPSAADAQQVFSGGPWNLRTSISGSTVTLASEPWQAPIPPQGRMSSGFNGGQASTLLLASSTDASLVFDPTVQLAAAGQTGALQTAYASAVSPASSTAASPGSPAAAIIPPVVTAGASASPTPSSTTPAATGSAGSFLFSPYKDATIAMNWNSNVLSTRVTGSLQPLLAVLPAGQSALTLAFATGSCGSENWGGIGAEAFAQANVPRLAAANVDYIVSTGGAAGAFTCGSDSGMIQFINRYASKNLVGIDFDIEAGQSASVIESLVQRVKDMQPLYPKLRWSFTVATLAPSQGGSVAASWGSSAPDGLNIYGDEVMQAIRSVGLTNYSINLMVMDYGAAQLGNCVLSGSTCAMGQSAIQAAMNLHDHWGIPYAQIELTPMIGGNDVAGEVFTLADVATMSSWAKAQGLAGVHFWSFDRDADCAVGSSSPICNSYVAPGGSGAGALGFDKAFLSALG